MNEAQILELCGLFVVMMGAGFTFSSSHYIKLVESIKNNSGVLLTFGGLNLVIGYLIISNYNTWSWDWSALVPLVGWAALLKGIVITVFPSFHLNIASWAVGTLGKRIKTIGIILIVFGTSLIYVGRYLV